MNETAYEKLFGAIIHRAIRDYQEYKLSKNKNTYIKSYEELRYIQAKHWLFSPPSAITRNLEGLLADYGYTNIDYIRRVANSETMIKERN